MVSAIGRVTFRLLLIGTAPLIAQDTCQPLYDAMLKVIDTPTHIYTTTGNASNSGGKPHMIEVIYTAGTVYTSVGGKWIRSKMTPRQVVKMEHENRRNSKMSCRYLKDESVNGETSAVYSTHTETDGQKDDGQAWISKTRGLPLRQEMDIDMQGMANKQHYSMRYEYTNVKPPQQ